MPLSYTVRQTFRTCPDDGNTHRKQHRVHATTHHLLPGAAVASSIACVTRSKYAAMPGYTGSYWTMLRWRTVVRYFCSAPLISSMLGVGSEWTNDIRQPNPSPPSLCSLPLTARDRTYGRPATPAASRWTSRPPCADCAARRPHGRTASAARRTAAAARPAAPAARPARRPAAQSGWRRRAIVWRR